MSDLPEKMATLARTVTRMKRLYRVGQLHKAERAALDAHDQTGDIRNRLLDEIWQEWQKRKNNESATSA